VVCLSSRWVGGMHLRGRWCAPFKRNTNRKTTLRRTGEGWPDAQVLMLRLGYYSQCAAWTLSISIYFSSLSSSFFLISFFVESESFFPLQWPENKNKMQKNTIELLE
jgi:hypothetical protein